MLQFPEFVTYLLLLLHVGTHLHNKQDVQGWLFVFSALICPCALVFRFAFLCHVFPGWGLFNFLVHFSPNFVGSDFRDAMITVFRLLGYAHLHTPNALQRVRASELTQRCRKVYPGMDPERRWQPLMVSRCAVLCCVVCRVRRFSAP